MSLRKTILLSVGLTFMGLVVLLLINLQTILSTHFAQEEQLSIEQDVRQASGALEGERLRLQQAAFEWARRLDWLGTGAESSAPFSAQDLVGAQASLVIWGGPRGQAGSLTAGGAALPEELLAWLQTQAANPAAVQGWLRTAAGPLMVALQPAAGGGWLAAGRLFDSDQVDALGGRTGLVLALYPVDAPDQPAEVRMALSSLQVASGAARGSQSRIHYSSGDDSISGYQMISDLAGQPAYLLRVQQPRTAYFGGRLVINYLITFLVVSGFVFAIIIIVLLERLVLARLSLLSRELNQIGATGDFTRRVTLSQNDELTRLGRDINGMLAELNLRMSDLQALYGQVFTARQELETLSRRMLEVQEEERRRIAQELHDEIGQELTGLKLLFDAASRQPEKMAQARGLVNELIGRVRQMSLDLRPAMLDDLGLLPALIWQIDRYTSLTGIEVQFNQVGLEGRRFSSPVEVTAYRLVQEALTNVARHACVQEASVRVWVDESALLVHISDQGCGFDPDLTLDAREGRGLMGMRERVKYVGGKLLIESQPGQGAQLTAELPATEPEREGADDLYLISG